jgi:hypothetical protein
MGNPPLGWCGPTRARSARVVPIAHGSLVVTRRVQLRGPLGDETHHAEASEPGGVVSLDLVNGFASNRTKPNVNPPMAVPYIRNRAPNFSFPWHWADLFIAASHALDAALLQHRRPLASCLRIGVQSCRPNSFRRSQKTASIVTRAEPIRRAAWAFPIFGPGEVLALRST